MLSNTPSYLHVTMLSSSSMISSQLLPLSLVALALLWLGVRLQRLLRHDLRNVPGPFWAKVSGLYRLSMVKGGRAPAEYRELHQKYGPVVRVGPNHVAVSDPSAIPIIYGLGSKFLKVHITASLSCHSVRDNPDRMSTDRLLQDYGAVL